MLHPGELGLEDLPEQPTLDPLRAIQDPEKATRANAEAARRIINAMIEHRGWLPTLVATRGLRAAAKALNASLPGRVAMHHQGFHDSAVYAPYGDRGYMTPNLYWSPGVVAPMPVLGRYWTVYSPGFAEPEAMAETAVNRAINEYLVDNAGICRFHRKWAEPLLEKLYQEVWGIDTNLRRHAAHKLLLIEAYLEKAGAQPQPWESRKTIDMVASIAAETGVAEWATRLATDPDAAREWWTRFNRKKLQLLARIVQEQPVTPTPKTH
jgi:glyceraldehyde-3-phosphate dehydrogenase (ferredoxin)